MKTRKNVSGILSSGSEKDITTWMGGSESGDIIDAALDGDPGIVGGIVFGELSPCDFAGGCFND